LALKACFSCASFAVIDQTSTLQQEAARKLGFTTKRTMMVAQQLYEGMNIGGGEAAGLITLELIAT
jgi:hypothetical protein